MTRKVKRRYVFSVAAFLFGLFTLAYAQEVEVLENYILKYSVTTSADKEAIWQLWEDVENWKKYDTRLEYSYLEDNAKFELGAIGYVKAQGAPRAKFKLIQVDPGVSFTERLYVPLYQSIDLKRYFEKSPEGKTTFTHEVHFKGNLRFLIYAIAAKAFKHDLMLVMTGMKALAESKSNS